jgi:hypothetical protein
VAPADIRWMLALTGPRIHAGNGPRYGRLGLDPATLTRTRTLIARALRASGQLTRAQIAAVLREAGLPIEGVALAHVMMHAELDGVVCSGPRVDRQFTYALLDARAPEASTMGRDGALGELARRYFTSRGPASLRDYTWWSGLTAADARRGIDIAGSSLASDTIEGRTFWSGARPASPAVKRSAGDAHLLPNYDEYLIAYRDREAVIGGARGTPLKPRDSDVFAPAMIVAGRLAGTWSRTVERDTIAVDVVSYRRLTPGDRDAVAAAVARYGRFMQQAVTCAQLSTR